MKKVLLFALTIVALLTVYGCGSSGSSISLEDYNAVVASRDALQTELANVMAERDALQAKVDEYESGSQPNAESNETDTQPTQDKMKGVDVVLGVGEWKELDASDFVKCGSCIAESEDSKIVSVDEDGIITANKKGKTKITYYPIDSNGKTYGTPYVYTVLVK